MKFLDNRLQPISRLLNHAFLTLKKNPDGVTRQNLFPPDLEPSHHNDAKKILVELNIVTHSGKIYKQGKAKKFDIKLFIRALQLTYWMIGSKIADSEKVYENKEAFEELLQYFKIDIRTSRAEIAEAVRFALKILRDVKLYKGGIIQQRGKFHLINPQNKHIYYLDDIPKENDLYDAIEQFFVQYRFRTEGNDYSGWSYLYNENNTPVKRKGELGNWGNPDLASFRVEHHGSGMIHSLEVMAVEVKRKEIRKNGRWYVNNLRKEWIAQAAAYSRFANITYLAINTTWPFIAQKPIALRSLLKEGIGLLLLEDMQNANSWYEALPPRFIHTRQGNSISFVHDFFPDWNGAPDTKTTSNANRIA